MCHLLADAFQHALPKCFTLLDFSQNLFQHFLNRDPLDCLGSPEPRAHSVGFFVVVSLEQQNQDESGCFRLSKGVILQALGSVSLAAQTLDIYGFLTGTGNFSRKTSG